MTVQDEISYNPQTQQVICRGEWTIQQLPQLQSALNHITWPRSGQLTLVGSDIKKMDSAGAWLLIKWKARLEQRKLTVHFDGFSPATTELIALIEKEVRIERPLPEKPVYGWFEKVGRRVCHQLRELQSYLSFVGHLTLEALRIGFNPYHWRFNSLISVIYSTGYLALPIIALLSFMVGVVIAYQMGLQLRTYGANIYIVDFLGLSILREFGPLLTAIMVAGRTGSAFTAQLGMMKLNQEIDALNTMGVTPAELLLLPRIAGLFIALPLLAMWSDIFGILGGMMVASNMLNITWYDFLQRFPHVIPLRTLIIGIGKAPVFALIIASIGCFQGIKVEGSAESVGKNTTRSVVMAIFFIILADALFSIIFSKLKL